MNGERTAWVWIFLDRKAGKLVNKPDNPLVAKNDGQLAHSRLRGLSTVFYRDPIHIPQGDAGVIHSFGPTVYIFII
jgi:hypothetical protein